MHALYHGSLGEKEKKKHSPEKVAYVKSIYTERLPAVCGWTRAFLKGESGEEEQTNSKATVWLLCRGLCRAESPVASSAAPWLHARDVKQSVFCSTKDICL